MHSIEQMEHLAIYRSAARRKGVDRMIAGRVAIPVPGVFSPKVTDLRLRIPMVFCVSLSLSSPLIAF
jgi:hypothetical protein